MTEVPDLPKKAPGGHTGHIARGEVPFWYRIAYGHWALLYAVDDAAARLVVVERHPHARGQRIEILPNGYR